MLKLSDFILHFGSEPSSGSSSTSPVTVVNSTDVEITLPTTTKDYTLVVDNLVDVSVHLPNATTSLIGQKFTIVKTNTNVVSILSNERILESTLGGKLMSEALEAYSSITLILVSSDKWVVTAANGTWNLISLEV